MASNNNGRRRRGLFAIWIGLIVAGLATFLVGINPDLIDMNRSETIGFVQMGVWLLGLAMRRVAASTSR